MTTTGIVIETRRTSRSRFTAYVAEGPEWARQWVANSPTRQGAFSDLRNTVRGFNPSVECIHAEC